jgi:hypothetical protein
MPESPERQGDPDVEEAYFRAWGEVGGTGRLRRTFSLHADVRRMVAFQIRNRHPEFADREVRRRTAQRMYLSDDAAQELLERSSGGLLEDQGLPETIGRISTILEGLGLRFHFTGGVAASYYGEPRLTQDLDLVVQIEADQPEARELLDAVSPGYLINESAAKDAIRSRRLFQAIDQESLIKINFHVGEKIPGELGRSRSRELFPGLVAPLVSQEDAILSKLIWLQRGSHKAEHDAKMMLKRDEDLDRAALQERAAALGLGSILADIAREP